jgi:hypothetical protein
MTCIDPSTLEGDLDRLEEIEKASLRLVTQAIVEFRSIAVDIFNKEKDKAQDIAEDITREALDRMGVSKIDARLFGKVDYKRARYIFHPEYAVRQALFVESKAEKKNRTSARLQIAHTSLEVRQIIRGEPIRIPGSLPCITEIGGTEYLTTTILVKYHYEDSDESHRELRNAELVAITVAALPNGFLQDRYNPTTDDDIWLVGPDAPTLDEDFRTRLAFIKLKNKKNWRVQTVPIPPADCTWDD